MALKRRALVGRLLSTTGLDVWFVGTAPVERHTRVDEHPNTDHDRRVGSPRTAGNANWNVAQR
jgi:hypothetical protein